MSEQSPHHRTVRSFVMRAGRITKAQQHALDHYWRQYGLTIASGVFDSSAVFGNDHPVVVEIGFGMGQSLLTMAQANPQINYVGIEVHRAGVGNLLKDIAAYQLENVRLYAEDAIEVFNCCITDHCLAGVQLYFPDPWHKKRHNKRRIVQPPFVALIAQKLQPKGFFHLATDWQPYAEHMMEVMSASTQFENAYGVSQYAADRPNGRPLTKFELRGERLGHGVWDLLFIVR